MTTLILGPVRSGKSARGVALARATGRPVTVAATAAVDPNDLEMAERIARHRRDRPREWTVIETAGADAVPLAELARDAPAGSCLLVDALGTWVASLMGGFDTLGARGVLDEIAARGAELGDALRACAGDAILVAEETGWGLVPTTPLGRTFRDALGHLTQRLARDVDRVELVVAGYALDLRALGIPIDGVAGEHATQRIE